MEMLLHDVAGNVCGGVALMVKVVSCLNDMPGNVTSAGATTVIVEQRFWR